MCRNELAITFLMHVAGYSLFQTCLKRLIKNVRKIHQDQEKRLKYSSAPN